MIRKLKIDTNFVYIDLQGDFWFYIPTEEKFTFICAYMCSEFGITSVRHQMDSFSDDIALDDDSDNGEFYALGDVV